MACPYFEPQHVNASPEHAAARMPLIDEYDGLCRAAGAPFPIPSQLRFHCCNHGNSRRTCAHFPAGEMRSALRYEIVGRTAAALELLLVEERDYTPHSWQTIRYSVAGELLEPEIADVAKQAQIRAFCRSFLEHFPA
ncbi:MAG TPA: hypothetical protein VGK64_28245 [Bryobacteraceae bacterium]